MSSYTSNIPQPGDDPSDSQDQILQNFQTLNTSYGSSGDHYPWTNTTPTEGLRHAKVRLPGLPTANPPGNVVPTPANNEGVIFGLTAGSQTFPFWRRDSGTSNYPMVAFRAFGRANGSALVGNAFNLSGVVQAGNNFTFTFTNNEPDTNYFVLATTFASGGAAIVTSVAVNQFVVNVPTGIASGMMVAVLRYTL